MHSLSLATRRSPNRKPFLMASIILAFGRNRSVSTAMILSSGRGGASRLASISSQHESRGMSRRTNARSSKQGRGQLSMWGEGPTGNGKESGTVVVPDDEGRRIRPSRRSPAPSPSSSSSSSWDDYRPEESRQDRAKTPLQPYEYVTPDSRPTGSDDGNKREHRRGPSNRTRNRKDDNNYASNGQRGGRSNSGGQRGGYGNQSGKPSRREQTRSNFPADEDRINLKELEMADLEHLYGLAPVRNALMAGRRDFSAKDNAEEEDAGKKAEARRIPHLFLQDASFAAGGSDKVPRRSMEKQKVQEEISTLAVECGLPVHKVDKGVLNALSGNRPHQGFVLRTYPLSFDPLTRIPPPPAPTDKNPTPIWLILDEIMDPQNFGALLRSAYFLSSPTNPIQVITCAKNSSPLTPVVSAASAGSLEFTTVHSTNNLPRLLNQAKDDGWRVLGAAATDPEDEEAVLSRPEHEQQKCWNLEDVKSDVPTLIVLGNEGSGLRTLVARACTGFVRIGGGGGLMGEEEGSVVDSLNVSVTGAVLLWSLVNGVGGRS